MLKKLLVFLLLIGLSSFGSLAKEGAAILAPVEMIECCETCELSEEKEEPEMLQNLVKAGYSHLERQLSYRTGIYCHYLLPPLSEPPELLS